MRISAHRHHDFSAGHRVHGHESKCAHLHGHNYRAHWEVVQFDMLGAGDTVDAVGRVMDFAVINTLLCQWLEKNWDHKFLAWEEDDYMRTMDHIAMMAPNFDGKNADVIDRRNAAAAMFRGSLVWVPFNPTAENMARYLVEVVGPKQLRNTKCRVVRVTIEETRKCSASYFL